MRRQARSSIRHAGFDNFDSTKRNPPEKCLALEAMAAAAAGLADREVLKKLTIAFIITYVIFLDA